MSLKCPKCGFDKDKDVTKALAKGAKGSKLAGIIIGAFLGLMVFGTIDEDFAPIGLFVGAFIGFIFTSCSKKIYVDAKKREVKIYKCKKCKNLFYQCNNCKKVVNLSDLNCPHCNYTIERVKK